MTEDEEFEALEQRLKLGQQTMKARNCQHRWEESDFGKRYWAPDTWQYTCKRCGAMKMFRMEGS